MKYTLIQNIGEFKKGTILNKVHPDNWNAWDGNQEHLPYTVDVGDNEFLIPFETVWTWEKLKWIKLI